MKVIVAVLLAIGSASAIGSGPYLPSGWRPQGPAFFLPSEVQKTEDNPLKETILETEASGSEGLREYGPPKVEGIQELNSIQTLPDVVTDQAFYSKAAEYVENTGAELIQAEAYAEPNAELVEATTEAVTVVQAEELIDARSRDVELESYTTSAPEQAEIAVVTEAVTDIQEVDATAAAITEAVQNIAQEENVEAITETQEVTNIPVLGKLVQQIVEADSELRTQEGSASVPMPEGLLEYGPPGFREYGPPKADQLLRSNIENEVRRRRFSPKFRSSKVLKH